jgi:putative transposase
MKSTQASAADAAAASRAHGTQWAIDFASDVAANSQRVRIFSVVDSSTRECLALEVDTSMPSRRITRALHQVIEGRGRPQAIRSDNGPEMSPRHYLVWCVEHKIDAVHIQPGKPVQTRMWRASMAAFAMSA